MGLHIDLIGLGCMEVLDCRVQFHVLGRAFLVGVMCQTACFCLQGWIVILRMFHTLEWGKGIGATLPDACLPLCAHGVWWGQGKMHWG